MKIHNNPKETNQKPAGGFFNGATLKHKESTMATEQKVIIATGYWRDEDKKEFVSNEETINSLLQDGWKVKQMTPMGAYGYGGYVSEHSGQVIGHEQDAGFASLVLLERES